MTTILPFVLLLVCPIAMILMMRGMMHGHKSQEGAADQPNTDKSLNLTQSHKLRDDLETRMEDLDTRIYELEASRPTTGATTAVTDS